MNQIEGRGEFPVQTARYKVGYSVTMEDGPVPVFVWYFLPCEVGAGYLEDSMIGAFNETISAFSFGRVCDDLGIFIIYTLEAFAPDEFSIKVGVVLARKSADVCAELRESIYDLV